MIRAECYYQTGRAGSITAEEILDRKATYNFVPYRSGTHMALGFALQAADRVRITLAYDQTQLPMWVTSMDARSITLEPASVE